MAWLAGTQDARIVWKRMSWVVCYISWGGLGNPIKAKLITGTSRSATLPSNSGLFFWTCFVSWHRYPISFLKSSTLLFSVTVFVDKRLFFILSIVISEMLGSHSQQVLHSVCAYNIWEGYVGSSTSDHTSKSWYTGNRHEDGKWDVKLRLRSGRRLYICIVVTQLSIYMIFTHHPDQHSKE